MSATEQSGNLFANTEALREHLERIGLSGVPLELLMLIRRLGIKDGSHSILQMSHADLVRHLNCTSRWVRICLVDLEGHGFLKRYPPPTGRVGILDIDWGAVWNCKRVFGAAPLIQDWVARQRALTSEHLNAEVNEELDRELNEELDRELNEELDRELNEELDRELSHSLLIDGLKDRKKERKSSFIHSLQGALGQLPPICLDPATEALPLYRELRAWWIAHGDQCKAAGVEAERLLAAVLATRRSNPALPLQYLLSCLQNPAEHWLAEARRFKWKCQDQEQRKAATYSPYG